MSGAARTPMSGAARPIVHIGYHKTATTWFQQQLWPRLASHDFIPRKTAQQAFLHPPGMHFDRDEAVGVLDLPGRSRPVVVSEENLSGYIHNGGLHGLIAPEMARRIHSVLPDARIVIFIRNQRDVVRASYCQYVSGGGTYSLRRYLATHAGARGALTRPYKAPAFEWEHFEFDRLVGYYDQLFGAENVHVYPYEALREGPGFLQRMAGDLGMQLPNDISLSRSNTSQSAATMSALRFVNLFTRQSVVNKSCLVDVPGGQLLRHGVKFLLKRVPGPPFRLPPRLEAQIDARYAQSNARLVNMRNLPLASLAYPL